jgi:hypothetical protein
VYVTEYVSIPDNNDYLSNSLLTTAKFITGRRYYSIIENDRKEDIILYCEKMDTNKYYSVEGNFAIVDIRMDLSGVTSSGGFDISYIVIGSTSIESSYHKYGIITVNKEICDANALYSESNRITVNKGVL